MNTTQVLESVFDFFYAKEILNKMHRVIKSNSLGCQHRRLSQLNHTCLSLSKHKQLELYFDNILLEVNEMNVLRHWDTAVSVMQDISPEFVYMYKLKIYCRDWREAVRKHWL